MYFEVFQGVHNQWYWRLVSRDEQKIAFSSKGYPTKQDILMNIEQIKKITHKALIREIQS
ncbi:YegP family protein [Bartonella sp. CB189]|uniref:YegP family protein n=1 Tax=Bartonella sp. CB189 TaxID=3112254 RepID=UPI002F966A36